MPDYRDHDEDEEEDDVAPWDEDDEDDTYPCPYCGQGVYEDAEWCPHCEKYLSAEDTSSRKSLWVVLVALVLLAAFVWFSFRH